MDLAILLDIHRDMKVCILNIDFSEFHWAAPAIYFAKKRIKWETFALYVQQQNGLAEQYMCIQVKEAQTIMIDFGPALHLRTEPILTIVYFKNKSPS